MAIKLNVTDCGTSIKGTGTLGCKVDINYLTQFFLLSSGTEFDLAVDTLDQAKIDELIQAGDMVVLPEHFSFTNEGGDTVYEELPSGAKIPVRNGLYEFLISYSSGICLSNALASLNSKSWSILMSDFDDAGEARLWGEETSNGKFKGFDTNLVYAENRSLNDGSTSTKAPLRIQLSTKGTQAMRSRVSYLSSNDQLDIANLDGVNDVNLSATNLTAAAFSVSAVIGCDGSTNVTSATDVGNWRITNTANGTVENGYSIALINGEYAITGLSAGDYDVEFYDEANSKGIIAVGGVYYDSDVLSVTLV